MATLAELDALIDGNPDAARGIAAAYEVLLGGVPSINGFVYLINNSVNTNFGSNNPAVTFNKENIFINIANALVQDNTDAGAAFAGIIGGASTLQDKLLAIYNAFVPLDHQTDAGRTFFTRAEAQAFFTNVAAERGVAGADGAAIVGLASLLNILVTADIGVGDSVNDLVAAIDDGSAALPETSATFIPIEVADGTNFDGDDVGPAILFTSGTDNIVGTAGNDTFSAPVEQTSGSPIQTLNNTDTVDGGAGRNSLTAQLVNPFTIPAGLTNIHVLNLDGAPGFVVPPVTLDVLNANALDTINFRAPANSITVNNVSTLLTDVGLNDDIGGNTFTITNLGTATNGTTDTLDVTIRNLPTGSQLNIAGYETINLASNGPVANAANANMLDFNNTAATTVNVTGDANLLLTGTALNIGNLETLDATGMGAGTGIAAAFTGGGTVTVNGSEGADAFDFLGVTTVPVTGGQSLVTVNGNGGADLMSFSAAVDATANGGAGADLLFFQATGGGGASFNVDDTAEGGADLDELGIESNNNGVLLAGVGANITGIERIVHSTSGAGATTAITADLSLMGSATEIQFIGDYNNLDITITNQTNTQTVIYSAGGAANAVDDINLDQAVDGALDNLHLTMQNNTAGGLNVVNDALITGADIEAVSIASLGDGNDPNGTAVNVIEAGDLANSDIILTGDVDFRFGFDSFSYDFDTGVFDAQAFTADLSLGVGGGNQTVIGGAGNDVIAIRGGYAAGAAGDVDVINLTFGGSDTVRFDGVAYTAPGTPLASYHRVTGFGIADDLLQIQASQADQADGGATAAADAALFLDYTAGTVINANLPGVGDSNFIKFTTASVGAATADAAFDQAIGLGIITVAAGVTDMMASMYDATAGVMILFNINAPAVFINAADAIDVLATVEMSAADYAAFSAGNIDFV
ncbi:beta strand repeat-containing protein [Arvimicrobium flavum]|uniref:beta strand repeat-containing protein n=1 Tax=Arvimicrobium flavum TaxID=3393320 RepID=UPI00237C36F7|nr:hypothetical protein [Mesorhizobium shangrilense]